MRTGARFADATTDLPALMDMDRASMPRRSREGQRPQARRDLDLVALGPRCALGEAATAQQGWLPH
jgi:hypothetical protein